MRLNEIINILKTTELKQIVVGEDDEFVLSLLNMAMIEIYAKLDILQEEQIIKLQDDITRYRLQDNSQRVIQVHRGRYYDDVMEEIGINDINDNESVFTPQPYVMHVPKPATGEFLSVTQTVIPPFITKDNVSTVDIIVPPQLLECIVNYCGYRAYISMNGDQQTESSSHYNRYMRSIQEVRKNGLTQQSMLTNVKQVERGFPSSAGQYVRRT